MEKTEALKNLINLINGEIELYEGLKDLFEKKRQVLVNNNVERLLEVDDKILTKVEEIKSSVTLRQTISKLIEKPDLSLSEMIELAKDTDNEIAEELKQSQKKVQKLIEEIAQQERIIKELLRHGMNMVSKTLNMISNAASIAGDYTRSGKNISSPLEQISSVIEEV